MKGSKVVESPAQKLAEELIKARLIRMIINIKNDFNVLLKFFSKNGLLKYKVLVYIKQKEFYIAHLFETCTFYHIQVGLINTLHININIT